MKEPEGEKTTLETENRDIGIKIYCCKQKIKTMHPDLRLDFEIVT